MRTLYTLILFLAFHELLGQNCQACFGDKGLSSNPANPQNCELTEAYAAGLVNPFLNTWNWAANSNGAFSVIQLNPLAGWQVPDFYNVAAPLNMQSPFYQGFLSKPGGTPIADFDFHWQDGWELIWNGLGYFPNGQEYQATVNNSIVNAPVTLQNPFVPYFVLYNRYNGKMRLFFNVFAKLGTYNHINLDIGYDQKGENINTSGIFRLGGGIDQALDLPTKINWQSAHFENFNNMTKWFMVEIQTTYDPCVCNYPSQITMTVSGVESSVMELTGRSISTTVPLRDANGKPTYTDFLNINTQQANKSGSGLAIYKSLDIMLSDYDKELKEYKDNLADYNNIGNVALRSLMGLAKNGLNAGLTGLVPSNILTGLSSNAVRVIYKNFKAKDYNNAKQWVIDQTQTNPYQLVSFSSKPEGEAAYKNMLKDAEKYSQDLSKTLKGGLGTLSDNLFATFYTEPEMPIPPTMPTATLTEMKIVGDITKTEGILVGDFYTPGSLNPPTYNSNNTYGSINFNAYPIYNEPLGLFAVLETPKVMHFENTSEMYLTNKRLNYFKLKESLKYRYNHSVDFNFNKTEIHGQLNFVVWFRYVSETFDILKGLDNLKILHQQKKDINGVQWVKYELVSDWYPIELIGEIYFGIQSEYSANATISFKPQFESVKLKLLNDMYFNQLAHDGKEINSTQVLTYLLYNKESVNDENPKSNHLIEETQKSVIKKYSADDLIIENEIIEPTDNFVEQVIGNIIYIKKNSVTFKGNISIATGYTVVVEAFWQIDVDPDCIIDPNISMEIKRDFYNFPETNEATNTDLLTFCSGLNKKYKANQFESPMPKVEDSPKQAKREKIDNESFIIFPNPSSSFLTISMNFSNNGTYILKLFDMMGKEVLENSVEITENKGIKTIPTDTLSNGVYLVEISNGEYKFTKKLIIQH